MIAGHYGLAAGVKTWAPRLPLWALMLSTFLLDVVFIFLNVAGLEYITPADPAHPSGYGSATRLPIAPNAGGSQRRNVLTASGVTAALLLLLLASDFLGL